MINRNYAWDLRTSNSVPFAYQIGYFTNEECDLIVQQGNQLTAVESYLGSNGLIDRSIRRNHIAFFDPAQKTTEWIYKKISKAVKDFNEQFWRFDLDIIETLQYTIYNEPNDFYTNHMDLSFGAWEQRKLSVSIQLSDANDYQGSNLEFMQCGDRYYDPIRDRGTVIMFPSFMQHRVSPLISGTRFSLVSWVIGPPFR